MSVNLVWFIKFELPGVPRPRDELLKTGIEEHLQQKLP